MDEKTKKLCVEKFAAKMQLIVNEAREELSPLDFINFANAVAYSILNECKRSFLQLNAKEH